MVKLLKNLSPIDWLLLAISIACSVVQVKLDLKTPEYMAQITTYIQTEQGTTSKILEVGAKMLFVAILSLVVASLTAIIIAKVSASFSANLRKETFSKVLDLSIDQINNFSIASLITRSTNDITHIHTFLIMGIQVFFKAPILSVMTLHKISTKSWQWSAATFTSIALLFVIIIVYLLLTAKKFRHIQELTDSINRVTRENLSGIQVVRAYNAEDYQERKFNDINHDLMGKTLFTNIASAFFMSGIDVITNGLSLSIYCIGAYLIYNAADVENRIGLFSDMIVYSSYAMQLLSAFMMIISIIISLPSALISGKRILEILKSKSEIKDGEYTGNRDESNTIIEFKNVWFWYPNSNDCSLRRIEFKVEKGQTIGIIGSTGCGKTTLVNMILRLQDATEGEIFIKNVNIKNYKKESLTSMIGYAPQNIFLFSGSISYNVAYSDNKIVTKPDEREVLEAIDTSQAREFVDQLDDKIESQISQNGTNFSGGQKQRIAIARALYKHPEILIFDDSFSALDYRTDAMVRKGLKEKHKDAVKIIVSQRISTILHADNIIVMEKGRIVGIGKHDDLMKDCDVYKQIAVSQLEEVVI